MLGYFFSIQLMLFQFCMDNSLFMYYVELVSHWIIEIAMAQQVALKDFMNTLDGLGAPVLKYHAHIFNVTKKKKPIRKKQPTRTTQTALNSIRIM